MSISHKFLLILIIIEFPHQCKASSEYCSLCKNSTFAMDSGSSLQKHISEVTITPNCGHDNKRNILEDDFCKGTIFSSHHIITSASCFYKKNVIKIDEDSLCVYARYFHLNDKINFLKMGVDNVTFHPRFNGDMDFDVAVIKVLNGINFDDVYCSYSKLPDNEIKEKNFEDNDCYISGYFINKHMDDLSPLSVKVEILDYDECVDFANVNNTTIGINENQFCVLFPKIEQQVVFHADGKPVICKNTVSAIMSARIYDFQVAFLIPLTDVGIYSTWARFIMLNLRSVDKSRGLVHDSAEFLRYDLFMFVITILILLS